MAYNVVISYLLIGVTLLPSLVNAQTCNNVTLPSGVSINKYNLANCVGRNVPLGGTCTVTYVVHWLKSQV